MKSMPSDFILGKKEIYSILRIVILLMSLFLVTNISIDMFKGILFHTQPSRTKIQLWICVWFPLDFVLEFSPAKHKWRYIWTHFIFLLVAIPYRNVIVYYGWTFSPEVTYLLRFIPLLRGGYALAIVVGWLTYSRAPSLLVSYLMTLLATVHFASLAFSVLEYKVNPLVMDYGDALWWAFMDVITVGLDMVVMTTTGEILPILLVVLGMIMFPIFTVYITNPIQQSNQKKKQYYVEEEEKKESIQGT